MISPGPSAHSPNAIPRALFDTEKVMVGIIVPLAGAIPHHMK
jgi:hypothetical protein